MGEQSDNDEDSGEGLKNDEWYEWTNNIVAMAKLMNRDVDKITAMTYSSFLFWSNYFKLKAEENFRHGV